MKKFPPPWPGWRWHIRQCCMWHLYWLWDWALGCNSRGDSYPKPWNPTVCVHYFSAIFVGKIWYNRHLSQGLLALGFTLWCPIYCGSGWGSPRKLACASAENGEGFPWKSIILRVHPLLFSMFFWSYYLSFHDKRPNLEEDVLSWGFLFFFGSFVLQVFWCVHVDSGVLDWELLFD